MTLTSALPHNSCPEFQWNLIVAGKLLVTVCQNLVYWKYFKTLTPFQICIFYSLIVESCLGCSFSMSANVTKWTRFIPGQAEVCKVHVFLQCQKFYVFYGRIGHISAACHFWVITHCTQLFFMRQGSSTVVGDTGVILYKLAKKRKERDMKTQSCSLSISHREQVYFCALSYPSELNK